jgi:transcription-repair coupling factor (superfamily II helicase)
MYKRNRILGDAALKRLNAIKEFTELGSGFSIANRDLSIRGAGDILGSEQAGFIDTVGIDLYLKILNDEIKNLKGEEVADYQESDTKPLLNVETHISNTYTDDTDLKIEIHQKINKIDSYEKLMSTKQELEDRFGKLNESIIIYMYEEWLEKLATKLEIEKVIQSKNSIEITLKPELTTKIDGEKLFYETYKITPMFNLSNKGGRISIVLNTNKLSRHYIYYLVDLLNLLSNLTND